jgi:hypothetical protein
MQYILSINLPLGLRFYSNHTEAFGTPDDIYKYVPPFLWSLPEQPYAKRFHSFVSAYLMGKYLMALFPDVITGFKVVKPTQDPPKNNAQECYDTMASIHKSLFGNTSRVEHILDYTALGSSRHPRNKPKMPKKVRGAKPPVVTYF